MKDKVRNPLSNSLLPGYIRLFICIKSITKEP